MTRRVLLAALACLLATGVGAADEEPRVEPWDGYLPIPEDRSPVREDARADFTGFVAVRAVDHVSGAPIPGARFRRYAEDIAPYTLRYAPLLAESTADADGFAWLPVQADDLGGHYVVDAPGYAPSYDYGPPHLLARLRRGSRVEARLVAPDGKPAAGVVVEIYEGCPHAPALQRATTTEDGTLRLDDVDLDKAYLWIVPTPGIRSALGLDAGDLLPWGSRVVKTVLPPGITVRGRVLEASGAPVVGATVRGDDDTRGPATTTDEQGAFALHGVEPGGTIHVFHRKDGVEREEDLHGVTGAAPVTVRFPPPDDAADDKPLPEYGHVDVTVVAADGRPLGGVGIRLVAPDGSSEVEATVATTREDDEEDEAEDRAPAASAAFNVVAGRYRIVAATPFEPVAFAPTDVDVVTEKTAQVNLQATAKPPVRLEGASYATVFCDGHEGVIAPAEERSAPGPGGREPARTVWLAPDAVAFVAVEGWGAVPVGPVVEGFRVARIPPQPMHVIAWRSDVVLDEGPVVMDPSGAPAEEFPGWIETRVSGPLTLEVRYAGEDLRIQVEVPEDPSQVTWIDRATLDAHRPAGLVRLSFRKADGTAIEPDDVEIEGFSPLDGESTYRHRGKDAPDEYVVPTTLAVSAPGLTTIDVRAEKPGEQVVAWGPAGVDLTVVGPDGKPADATLFADGHFYRVDGGRLRLEGFAPGERTLLVSPRTTALRSIRARVTLGAGAPQPIRVALPAR